MKTQPPLFPELPEGGPEGRAEACRGEGVPRVRSPVRNQLELRAVDLEATLGADHPARAVWAFAEGLDLSALYARIEAVEGRVGRPAIDPRLLLALWLYATVEGVGSARALARLCESHDAYRWLCGGVTVNHHTLADFRVAHVELLDELLTRSVAALMHAGAVELKRLAQDGMRVRASAGAASFRRRTTLNKCLRQARSQVNRLRRELEADPAAGSRRERAARERAAAERERRVARALEQLAEVERRAKKPRAKKDDESEEEHAKRTEPRASTSDPEARVMKMPDGGFRPAYNVQFATDTHTQLIAGVAVSNSGGDMGQMTPMLEQLEQRYEHLPEEILVDGGFANREAIAHAEQRGVCVYAPVPKPKDPGRDPHTPRPGDSPAVAAWRERMGRKEAKAVYRQRAATAECVNAIARGRGLLQFTVRGVQKARAVALWYALAHNLMRSRNLLQAAPAPG